jgi:hypothetical protein
MHVEKNEVNTNFFSQNNIDLLQNTIVSKVKEHTNVSISRQSDNELYFIMNYCYANFSVNNVTDIKQQIRELNSRVLNIVVPMVVSGMKQQNFYLKDKDTNIEPIELGSSTSIKGIEPLAGSNIF